MTSKQQNTK